MTNPKVLAVVNDIFFSAKINEGAKQAGVQLVYVANEAALLEKAKDNPALIIFDLNFSAGTHLVTDGQQVFRRAGKDSRTLRQRLLRGRHHRNRRPPRRRFCEQAVSSGRSCANGTPSARPAGNKR